jgi:xylitol oxidase
MFTMQPSHIQKLYEKLPDYQAMLKHYDPNGKFRNDFLNTNLFGA